MSLRTTTVLAGALLGVAVIIGCDRGPDPAKLLSAPRPAAAVTATAAVSEDVPVYLDQIGKIVSIDAVSIVPQVAGKIISSPVEDGAEVKKGQLLFEIDPRPFEATVAAAQASVAETKANVSWATIEFNRIKTLVETKAVSPNEYDKAKNTLDVANAKALAADADLKTAQLNLEYCKIYSPLDGRAGAKLIVAGNVVKANEGVLLTIQRLDPIYAEFTVTENDLGTVRKFIDRAGLERRNLEQGLKVEVDVPGDSAQVLTALGSGPTSRPSTQPSSRPNRVNTARAGMLTFLDNTVQQGTGTVKLRATLPNSDNYFWPGQFVQARLILKVRKDAVLIPAEAQQIGQQGAFVYVVKGDNTAEQRPIVPGQRHGNLIVVDHGVESGEKVIVTGQMLVAPGGPVRVLNAPTTAPAVASAK